VGFLGKKFQTLLIPIYSTTVLYDRGRVSYFSIPCTNAERKVDDAILVNTSFVVMNRVTN